MRFLHSKEWLNIVNTLKTFAKHLSGHCEERSDVAISVITDSLGLLHYVRNDSIYIFQKSVSVSKQNTA